MTDVVDALVSMKNTEENRVITWGVVTSVSPTEVRFGGDTVDVEVASKLAGYTPTTNDVVVLLKVGTSWVIIGDIG